MANKIWIRFKKHMDFQVGDKVFVSIPGKIMTAIGKMTTSHGNTKYRIYLEYNSIGCDFTIDEDVVEELNTDEANLCKLLAS